MASTDSIIKLKVESKEYEQKLERAAKGLQHLGEYCQKAGKNISDLDKESVDYVRAIGQMESKNKSARGSLSEMTKSFTDMSVAYRKLTDDEKQTPFGQALAKSLDELKVRIQQDKQQLDDITKSLQTTTGESNKMTGMVDMLGQKLGLGGNLTEMLTSKTAMLTAGMTAAAAAVGKATQAWVAYNNELAKQDQITTVTTGLKGGEAEHMTDTMRSIADTYNVDFREAINAANTLMTQFGATGDEAIRLIKDGMQGMIQGDGPKLLSMINQYAPAFQSAGVSASQLIAVIQNSEGGIFTDQNMQAIIMGLAKIRNMTTGTADALKALGIDADKMKENLRNGSMTIFEALQMVGDAIDSNKGKTEEVGAVMQEVFGRQARTAGDNLGKAIATLNTNLEETKKQTGEVGESFARLQEANERLNTAIRDCFEYDGWNQMTNDIKAGLIAALTEVIEDIGLVKNALSKLPKEIALISGPLGAVVTMMGDLGIKAENSFTAIRNGATLAMGPVGALFNMLKALGGKSFSQAVSDAAVGNFTIYDPGDHKDTTSTTTPTTTPRRSGRSGGGGGNRNTTPEKELTIQQQIANLENEALTATEERRKQIKQQIQELDEVLQKQKEIVKSLHEVEDIDFEKMFPTITPSTPSKSMGENMVSGIMEKVAQDIQNADVNTLKTLLTVAIQNGIEGVDIQTDSLMEQIIGDGADIPDEMWQALQDQINEKLKEMGIEPIQIDFKTGGLKQANKEAKESSKNFQTAASAIQSVGSALQSLEDPGAKVAGIIANAIANIALAFSESSIKAAGGGPVAWIAATASGLATMISTIAAIKSATASKGYAEGGIVKGNSFSGDNIPADTFINAGELVLNRSQQMSIAAQLQDGERRGGFTPSHISGEQIYIALNRYTKRTGRGELVTWK